MLSGKEHRANASASSYIERRGAVLPLVAVFVVVLIAMAALSIDIAYIQLVRTQLKAATDAAAKAGTSALVQGKNDADATAAAIAMASLNKVAGKPLSITASDIVLGQSIQQADRTWSFVAGLKPSQAVQVTSSLSKSSANGSVSLIFGPILGTKTYSTSNTSVASAFACEVCLVLDRSHSMCFDQTGTQFSYPAPIYTNINLGIKTPPVTGSRWLALQSAMNSFCDILSAANAPPRVAVVTWADTIGTNTTEYALTGQTSPAVTVDLGLTSTMSAVSAAVRARSAKVMLGATNMAAGMDQGTAILTASNVRPYAKKVMILMTDGQWNAGRDPIAAASDALTKNITIHCICFLKNSDQTTTQKIASMTGGQFYYATDAASLTAAFQKLAYSLPVVLTK